MRLLLTCMAVCAMSCTAAQAQSTPSAGSSATSEPGAAMKASPDKSTTLPSGGGATPSKAAPLQSPESKKEAQDGTGAPAEPAKK